MIPRRRCSSEMGAGFLPWLVWTAAGTLALAGQEVDPAAYEHLVEPRIVERADERLLQVRAVGDPNEIGSAAFGLLFQLYSRAGRQPVSRQKKRAGPRGPTLSFIPFFPPCPQKRWGPFSERQHSRCCSHRQRRLRSLSMLRCALLPFLHPLLFQLPEGLGEFRA